MQWDKDEKRWVTWDKPEGLKRFSGNKFQEESNAAVSPFSLVENPKRAKLVWMAKTNPVDPLSVDAVVLKFESSNFNAQIAKEVRLIWRSGSQPKSWIDYSEGPQAELILRTDQPEQVKGSIGELIFEPLHHRSWLLKGPIVEIGLKLPPGQYSFKPMELKSADAWIYKAAAKIQR